MVLTYSNGISRAPPYSFSLLQFSISTTGVSPSTLCLPMHFVYEKYQISWIWVPPLSLVTTHRIANLLSFPHPTKIFQFGWCCLSYDIPCLQHGELPHSEIHGSLSTSYSPWRIAGSCVLHRLLVPRHPLCALISLTFIIFSNSTNFIYFSKI